MEEENTIDSVMQKMDEFAKKGIPMSPQWYVERAQILISLMGDETDKLHELQKKIARARVVLIESGKSVAHAKIDLEAEDVYQEMQNQKAKCERITEIIRIAKIQSRMRSDEWGGGSL